jgi:hypothetical protein
MEMHPFRYSNIYFKVTLLHALNDWILFITKKCNMIIDNLGRLKMKKYNFLKSQSTLLKS